MVGLTVCYCIASEIINFLSNERTDTKNTFEVFSKTEAAFENDNLLLFFQTWMMVEKSGK